MQRGDSRLRISAQLIDAETGNHLWAERFDKPVADLFDMQDEKAAGFAILPHCFRSCETPAWSSLEFAERAMQPAVMMKRVLVAAFVAVFLALALASARAQSADLVLCDRLAADVTDPDRPADVKGVADVATADIATAIKFCKKVAAGSRRAMFELGRAYAANQQIPDAIAAWRKAVDKGSSAAMVELGVLYGTGTGVAKDVEQARKLF